MESDFSLKVSYADMDDVEEEKEPKKRKRTGILSREEWDVGKQVEVMMIIISYSGGDTTYHDDHIDDDDFDNDYDAY